LAKRKAKDDGFNTSVPDLIAQFRESIELFLNHPAIPSPWPAWVPSPAGLNWRFNHLEEAQRVLNPVEVSGMAHREPDPDLVSNIKRRDKIRRELKSDMAKLLRYVEQALTGSDHLLPPGFHLIRNPGCAAECAAYGTGLATADSRSQQHRPETNLRLATVEARKNYLVRAVRPVFQAACIEVEARDPKEAIDHALSSAAQIPEALWTGRSDPESYFFDAHCVHTGQTAEGHPFSLLDFPRYTVISTNPFPPIEAYGVLDPWMDKAPPILVASLLSTWIDQLLSSQVVIFEDAKEMLQENLQQWKGSDDEKILPLMPPDERRFLLEMTEQLIRGIDLLEESDD